MAYIVGSTKSHVLKSNQKYFLDANIWINVLASPTHPSHRIKQYLAFFDKLLAYKDIKIVVPMLLISEVINRIIKDVHFISFAKKNGLDRDKIPTDFYKTVFRPSNDYIVSFQILTDDFNSYTDHIEFVNDGLGNELTNEDILNNIDQYFDFNDNFYYQISLKRNYIIVTDDKDFWREDVVILTENSVLLDKQTQIDIKNQADRGVIKFGTLKNFTKK